MRPLVLLTALGLLVVGAARADDSAAGSIGAELTVDNDSLVVDNVDPGGPGEKSGLKAGEVIIKINNLIVTAFPSLRIFKIHTISHCKKECLVCI